MTDSGDQTTCTFSYDIPADSDGRAIVSITCVTDDAGNANAAATDNTLTIESPPARGGARH